MGKKAAIGLIIIIGVAGGVAGWYFFLRPKEADYSGLLILPLLLPELPTPPVKIDSSVVGDLRHGVGIFVGDYTLKNFDNTTVPSFPDFVIPLIGSLKVQNTTVVTNPISVNGTFRYINLFEDATLKMTNVSYPNLEINCFGRSKLTIDNCTIGSIYARDDSTVTVKNSSVTAIYDADPVFLTLYEVLGAEAEAIDSKIKVTNSSVIDEIVIKTGADIEIDNSTVGFMIAESTDSAKLAVVNITTSTMISNLTLGASSDATITTLIFEPGFTFIRLEADAKATISNLNVVSVMVVQAAQCALITSIVTSLAYGIVVTGGTTTVNNWIPSGGTYQNNFVSIGSAITSSSCMSVLVASPVATANIINCGGSGRLDSVMAAAGRVTMKNVTSVLTIAKDSSVFNITQSTLTTLVTYDNSQVQINQSVVVGTAVGISVGGQSLSFPVGIITSDNSILTMQNSTAFALTGGDSSQLYLDNITIPLILDIETVGTVQVTNNLGNNTILALEVGMATQGGPVGNVLIQGAKFTQASVKGSAVVSFVSCNFLTGILLEGIIVSSGVTTINAGVQTGGTSTNYTTLDAATKLTLLGGNRVIGNVEVNNSATLNMFNGIPLINVSIDMYHNSQAILQNVKLGLVFMYNSSTASMTLCEVQPPLTGLYALVVIDKASVQCIATNVSLFLAGRDAEQAAYSAIFSTSSIIGIGYVVGYAKIQLSASFVGLYIECAAGADTGKYAIELLAGTQAAQVNARSWAPLA